jgi:hypothetical protein
MRTGEARLLAKQIIAAPDPIEAARLYADAAVLPSAHPLGETAPDEEALAESNEIDRLKVAQYALLAGPISKGVRFFLDHADTLFATTARSDAVAIANRVGEQVSTGTRLALRDTQLAGQIEAIAERRVNLIRPANGWYANLISPFAAKLREAARSSAHNTALAIVANAFTIQLANRRISHEAHVDATRASHGLALAHPMVNIKDMTTVSNMLTRYSHGVFLGDPYPEELLRYDAETDKVVLAKGMQRWQVRPGQTLADIAGDNMDVTIGCPFTFAPTELRTGYYEAVVDLMERHRAWPEIFSRLTHRP